VYVVIGDSLESIHEQINESVGNPQIRPGRKHHSKIEMVYPDDAPGVYTDSEPTVAGSPIFR
jgi:hypothetical protein